jgi:hypothetical protein
MRSYRKPELDKYSYDSLNSLVVSGKRLGWLEALNEVTKFATELIEEGRIDDARTIDKLLFELKEHARQNYDDIV